MAVFWVDPYINAPIGGIHGTLDGTTRNGTYSYPFSLDDIFPTDWNFASVTAINGVAIADNDELRLKGLPLMDFMLDAGNNYYMTNFRTVRRNTYNAAITTEFTGTNNCLVMAVINPANTLNNCIVLSNCAHSTDTTSYNQLSVYNQSPMTGIFAAQYRLVANANFQIYFVKKQYYITSAALLGSGQTQYFSPFNRGITITDGWTSETVRDGTNILCLGTTQNNFKYLDFNNQSNGTGTASDTLYDMPNTSLVIYNSTSGTNGLAILPRLWSCSKTAANGGINFGNTKTQKFGNIYVVDFGYGEAIGRFWDNRAATDYDDASCNNFEINAIGAYFTRWVTGYRGKNVTGTLRNAIGYHFYPHNNNIYDGISTQPRTMKYGSMCGYQADSSNGWLYFTNYINSLTIELLSNSTIFAAQNGAGQFLNYTGSGGNGPTFVFGTNIQARLTATTLGPNVSATSSTASGPFVLKGINNTTSVYSGSINMNTSATPPFYEVDGVGLINTTMGMHTATNSYGVLDTLGVDYKNTDHNIYTNYPNTLTTGGGLPTVNNNYHFSTNTYDYTPIGVIAPSNRQNSWNRGTIYYNDSTKTGALCFQSNGYAVNGDVYVKAFEVEIPFYTTQSVKIEFDLETSADWNSNITVNVFYRGSTGSLSVQQLYSSSSAVTTKTTYSTTISNSNMSPSKLRHMLVRVQFTNTNTFTKKFWAHDVRAVLV
jgi:hypothetical protein